MVQHIEQHVARDGDARPAHPSTAVNQNGRVSILSDGYLGDGVSSHRVNLFQKG